MQNHPRKNTLPLPGEVVSILKINETIYAKRDVEAKKSSTQFGDEPSGLRRTYRSQIKDQNPLGQMRNQRFVELIQRPLIHEQEMRKTSGLYSRWRFPDERWWIFQGIEISRKRGGNRSNKQKICGQCAQLEKSAHYLLAPPRCLFPYMLPTMPPTLRG